MKKYKNSRVLEELPVSVPKFFVEELIIVNLPDQRWIVFVVLLAAQYIKIEWMG